MTNTVVTFPNHICVRRLTAHALRAIIPLYNVARKTH